MTPLSGLPASLKACAISSASLLFADSTSFVPAVPTSFVPDASAYTDGTVVFEAM